MKIRKSPSGFKRDAGTFSKFESVITIFGSIAVAPSIAKGNQLPGQARVTNSRPCCRLGAAPPPILAAVLSLPSLTAP